MRESYICCSVVVETGASVIIVVVYLDMVVGWSNSTHKSVEDLNEENG